MSLPVHEKTWAKILERPKTCRKKKYMDYYPPSACGPSNLSAEFCVSAKFCDEAAKTTCNNQVTQFTESKRYSLTLLSLELAKVNKAMKGHGKSLNFNFNLSFCAIP